MNGKAGLLSDAVPGQFVCRVYETVCFALGSCTTGTANAVYIGFHFVRNVVIDDTGDRFNVEASGSHIGGYESCNLLVPESFKNFEASFLIMIPVK